ncbi:MAG: carbon storage regulator [Myxococcota bacterium]
MLIIRRRVGERIVIGSNIEISVASATKKAVRLAISAPKGVPVLRGEVHDSVVAANVAAATGLIEEDEPPDDDAEASVGASGAGSR